MTDIPLINAIEQFSNWRLPTKYLTFVGAIDDSVDIEGTGVCIYAPIYLIECNTTYEVPTYVPDALMIAQDGDMGYFLVKHQGDTIFCADLGALGSVALQPIANHIDEFITTIYQIQQDNNHP